MDKNKSTLWCVALELAWKKAMVEFFEGPIPSAGPNPLYDRLNASTAEWGDWPAEQLSLSARRVSSLRYQIKGSLNVNVPFRFPFFDGGGPVLFQDGRQRFVQCFGLACDDADREVREQVSVLYEDPPGDSFAIDPCRHSDPFRLVLALVERQKSLGQTIRSARGLIERGEERPLGERDTLLIPCQSWCVQHRFPEFSLGLGEPYQGGSIEIEQDMRFLLDRYGARLNVQILASFKKHSSIGRDFVFDRPFLLYVESRQTGRLVFAEWLQNSELMVQSA